MICSHVSSRFYKHNIKHDAHILSLSSKKNTTNYVGYEVRSNCCYFTITSRKENGYSERLSHLLEESLLEIQSMIEAENPTKSKL